MNNNLTSCKHCNDTVSKSAKKCPHCGAKLKWSAFEKLIGTTVIGFTALVIMGAFSGPNMTKSVTTTGMSAPVSSDAAAYTVHEAIKARLKDPDSFKDLDTKIFSGKHPLGYSAVTVEYTATNGFGGRVKNAAIGVVDQNGSLISINLEK